MACLEGYTAPNASPDAPTARDPGATPAAGGPGAPSGRRASESQTSADVLVRRAGGALPGGACFTALGIARPLNLLGSTGQGGTKIYAITRAFAHNARRMFIGNPNGISPADMRRLLENILSLALRCGTTDLLAPRPVQIRSDNDQGVQPLRWTYGHAESNIEALIAVNVGATETAFSEVANWDFDAATRRF